MLQSCCTRTRTTSHADAQYGSCNEDQQQSSERSERKEEEEFLKSEYVQVNKLIVWLFLTRHQNEEVEVAASPQELMGIGSTCELIRTTSRRFSIKYGSFLFAKISTRKYR